MPNLPCAIHGEGIRTHLQQWRSHRERRRFGRMAVAFLPVPTSTAIQIQVEGKGETTRAPEGRGRANALFTPCTEMDSKYLDRCVVILWQPRAPCIRPNSRRNTRLRTKIYTTVS